MGRLLGATSLAVALSPGFRNNWQASGGVLRAERVARADPALCGLGLRWPRAPWHLSRGDVFFGRHVPMYAFGSPAGVRRVASAVNYVIGGADVADGLPGFSVRGCWRDAEGVACLAGAEGRRCVADPAFEINNVPDLGRASTRYGADTSG